MAFSVTLSDISLFLIALAFFILVIYLIPTVLQIRQTMKALEELSLQGKDAMGNINNLVKKTGGQAGEIGGLVRQLLIREGTRKVLEAAGPMVSKFRRPLITLISLLVGINLGLRYLTGNKKKKEEK
jgi:predicted PurR-regulated permease PerM